MRKTYQQERKRKRTNTKFGNRLAPKDHFFDFFFAPGPIFWWSPPRRRFVKILGRQISWGPEALSKKPMAQGRYRLLNPSQKLTNLSAGNALTKTDDLKAPSSLNSLKKCEADGPQEFSSAAEIHGTRKICPNRTYQIRLWLWVEALVLSRALGLKPRLWDKDLRRGTGRKFGLFSTLSSRWAALCF